MQHFGRWLAAFHELRQHLQRSNGPVPGGRMIEQNHMSRLLPTNIHAPRPHFLQYIAVTNLGAHQFQMLACQIAFQPQVRHHRCDDAATSQQAIAAERCRHQRHDLVAIDDPALLIHDDQPVGIAIQRNTDMCARRNHRFLQRRNMRRADPVVDIAAIGIDPDGRDLCPQFPNCRRRHLISRPVCAIEDDMQAIETDMFRNRSLDRVDITTARVLNAARAANVGSSRKLRRFGQQCLNRHFVLIR